MLPGVVWFLIVVRALCWLVDRSKAKNGRPATLTAIHKLLEQLTDSESGFSPTVQASAASAVDAGLTLFYPSKEDCQKLLKSLVSRGGVVEVQFKFPTLRVVEADEKVAPDADLSDLRFERLLLMLQVECEAMGWRTQLEGEWDSYSHLVIGTPCEVSVCAVLLVLCAVVLLQLLTPLFLQTRVCRSPEGWLAHNLLGCRLCALVQEGRFPRLVVPCRLPGSQHRSLHPTFHGFLVERPFLFCCWGWLCPFVPRRCLRGRVRGGEVFLA